MKANSATYTASFEDCPLQPGEECAHTLCPTKTVLQEQLTIFRTLSRNFKNLYLVNLHEETAKVLKYEDEYQYKDLGVFGDTPFPYVLLLNEWIENQVHPDDQERIKKELSPGHLRQIFAENDEYIGAYRMLVDGRIINYQYNLSKSDVNGYVIAGFQNIEGIIQEHLRAVEKEKEKEKELHDALLLANQATRAKSMFLSNMSHDIRTPMNAIIGYTSLAQTHLEDKELVQDYLEKIQTSSMHLLNLINQILDMSRIESGTVKLEEGEVRILDVLHDLHTIIQGQVSSKQQHLSIDLVDITHKDVITDKLRLSQVLLNIVSNAAKYTDVDGTIIIRVTEKPCSTEGYATYEFSVKDNGKGMSPEFLEHVFDSFARERTSTASGVQGTGLGMSITKNIVGMMGGTITVESELGRGTEFVVTVDFKIASAHVASKNADTAQRNYHGKRVLLVEDNDLNREIATALLEELGMVVDEARDGTEAVTIMNAANEDTYNIIFMDIQMPMMDGYTATREIRTLSNNKIANIPIVAMTANAFDEDKKKAFEAGMNAHIAKPVNVEEIAAVLEDIF
jgi:signal transduction histidine kinase/CheY-like chemotaxis protein